MRCSVASCLAVALLLNAICVVRQLQEKHLAANKPFYVSFVDPEKAFDRVPRDVIWWGKAQSRN